MSQITVLLLAALLTGVCGLTVDSPHHTVHTTHHHKKHKHGKSHHVREHHSHQALELKQKVSGGKAVVWAYHDRDVDRGEEAKPQEWLAKFTRSVEEVRKFHPDADFKLVLVTNVEAAKELVEKPGKLFDDVIIQDLHPEEGTLSNKKVKGVKAVALYNLFKKGLYDQCLYLDPELKITRHGLAQFFEPLEFYDIVGTMEGFTEGPEKRTVANGWELSTGAFAIKKESKKLLKEWIDEFFLNDGEYKAFATLDQQALMSVIQRSPEYRFFPLPMYHYGLKEKSVYPTNYHTLVPVVWHAHANVKDNQVCEHLSKEWQKAHQLATNKMLPQCQNIRNKFHADTI